MKDPFFSPPAFLADGVRNLSNQLSMPILPLHIHEVLLGWACYHFMDKNLAPMISKAIFPNTYNRLDARGKINWDMRIVSFIQSVLIGAVALYVKLYDQDVASLDWKGRIWSYNGNIGMVQGFAAGYFLWDLSVCIIHYRLLGPETLAHAISALVLITLAFRPFVQYYGLSFIFYELSTPFLNIHWFLDKFGKTGSIMQLINGITLVSTFVLCRLVWGSYNIVCMSMDFWKAIRTKSLDAAFASSADWKSGDLKASDYTPFPLWLVGIFLGGNLLLWSLNVFWLNKMIQALQKRFTPVDKAEKSK